MDDLIIFSSDGMFSNLTTPLNTTIPIIPVNIACDLLVKNITSSQAMINNFFGCLLKWQSLFYMMADHFLIHSVKQAYAGPEVNVVEKLDQTKVVPR
jgi:hypothetical protein